MREHEKNAFTGESVLIMVPLLSALFVIYFSLLLSAFQGINQLTQLFGTLIFFFLFLLVFVVPSAIFIVAPHIVSYFAVRGLEFVPNQEYPQIERIMIESCKKLGIKNIPELLIASSRRPNCFVYGFSMRRVRLVITTGCISLLNKRETTAAILHELCHIKNKDVGLMTLGVLLMKVLIYPPFLATIVLTLNWIVRDPSSTVGLARQIFLLCTFFIIQIVLPRFLVRHILRTRELFADAKSLTIHKDGTSLISAIKKIGRQFYLELLLEKTFRKKRNLIVSAFGGTTSFFDRGFQSSPHLGERIQAIKTEKFLAKKGRKFLPSFHFSLMIGVATFYLLLPTLYSYVIFSILLSNRLILIIPWRLTLISPISLLGFFGFPVLFFISLAHYLSLRNSDYYALRLRDCVELIKQIFISAFSFSATLAFMQWHRVFVYIFRSDLKSLVVYPSASILEWVWFAVSEPFSVSALVESLAITLGISLTLTFLSSSCVFILVLLKKIQARMHVHSESV